MGGLVSGENTQDALLLLPSSNHTVTKQQSPRGLNWESSQTARTYYQRLSIYKKMMH